MISMYLNEISFILEFENIIMFIRFEVRLNNENIGKSTNGDTNGELLLNSLVLDVILTILTKISYIFYFLFLIK